MVSIYTGLLIMLAVRTRRPFFRSRPGHLLIVAAAGVAIITLIIPFSDAGKVFGLIQPSISLLGLVAMISAVYAVAIELGKRLFFGSSGSSSEKVIADVR